MSLFPDREAAVKVLYKAAGQLLDTAAEHTCLSRELCRRRAFDCVELAEKIGQMGQVTIHTKDGEVDEVEGIPFDLGYVVDMLNSASQEDSRKEPKP